MSRIRSIDEHEQLICREEVAIFIVLGAPDPARVPLVLSLKHETVSATSQNTSTLILTLASS